MLGDERDALASLPAFGEALNPLAATVTRSGEAASALAALYIKKSTDLRSPRSSTRLGHRCANAGRPLSTSCRASPPMPSQPRRRPPAEKFTNIQKVDLDTVVAPTPCWRRVIVILVCFGMEAAQASRKRVETAALFSRRSAAWLKMALLLGVVAQTAYVGAQIMCWTFIIQYAELELGISKSPRRTCTSSRCSSSFPAGHLHLHLALR